MSILVVDDSSESRMLIKHHLKKAGYTELITAESAQEAFEYLGMNGSKRGVSDVELILMDIVMPGIDGIEACRKIKEVNDLRDIPVIMVTAEDDDRSLNLAFEAKAVDYVVKPINKVALTARVNSVMRLKRETDARREFAAQLKIANKQLQALSSMDGLTGIANRRTFDELFDKEWHRALRGSNPLSIIMIDIDFFKRYNDGYGHLAGDECLKKIGGVLKQTVKRPGDLVARYGGEEFVVILSNTNSEDAVRLGKSIADGVKVLNLPHAFSDVSPKVSLSMGVASLVPARGMPPLHLVNLADKALYKAKEQGRDMIVLSCSERDGEAR